MPIHVPFCSSSTPKARTPRGLPRRASTLLFFSVLGAGLIACGSGAVGGLPATSANRESGQSSLMDKTAAGADKCSPKNHKRPFVIEWDATDMSSFESKAANDVVVVKYEGCDLEVLDGCAPAIKGSIGAYGAVEWTSGSVEKVDISNEGDLYAKLPLGVVSLGGRVSAGEQFHMEYYVSGTRTLTRPEVFRKDLDKIAACKGATHFVAGYNLGAFALGSEKNIHGDLGATVWGIGGGASKTSMSSAEKKGGVLTSCTVDSAREVSSCKVPIRLTLREISEGEDSDVAAASASETSGALNLAGKVDQKIRMDDAAQARLDAALDKQRAGDGPGCLKELDHYDKVNRNATQLSTNPKFFYSQVRAQCVMMSGRCDAGKSQMRKAIDAQQGNALGPAQIDAFVDMTVGKFCKGNALPPRDQLLQAHAQLQDGANNHKLDSSTCTRDWETVKRLSQTVQPRDEEDWPIKSAGNAQSVARSAASCLGRAGDCDAAFKAHSEDMRLLFNGNASLTSPDQVRKSFGNYVPQCKGK